MPFPNDRYGFHPLSGDSGFTRFNIKFTGELSNGMPFIGCITFDDGDEKYTLEGKFNHHLQIIGVGKQTCTVGGMMIIGNHDENGMLQG